MPLTCEIIEPRGQQDLQKAFADDVRQGLSRTPKAISSAWFYDDRGSQLFEEITRLAEYYPTRCEREILERHAADIGQAVGQRRFRVIEIGAGDGQKTEILLRRFLSLGLDFEYVPIDICRRSIVDLVDKLRRTIGGPGFHVRGIVAEYRDALAELQDDAPRRNLVLFLGSSIGNFDHGQARVFLRGLRRSLQAGDLALIGFDLKKDPDLLLRAYDDPQGVTREFNLNLLDRMNRELGARFDRARFRHHASYNAALGCMESYLISCEQQSVSIQALGRDFLFEAWEGIRVECSYKYDPRIIESLARAGGFCICRNFLDQRQWFVDSLWLAQ